MEVWMLNVKFYFDNELIVYQSTQNDETKLDSSAEINIHIDELLALIRSSNRFKKFGIKQLVS